MQTKYQRMRRGLSLVEVVISTMLVGVVLVSAMSCFAGAIRLRMATGDTSNAKNLANQLMAEILENDYEEPIDSPVFGPESPESVSVRADWDDVDDYNLWSATPPQDRTGTIIPDSTGWQRSVVVEWVDPNTPALTVGSDQGIKRVTVTVQRNGQILAQKMALRSDKYTGESP